MQLIKDLSPPCFAVGERELETKEMPSVSRSFSRSRLVLARSMAPLFLPFSIRPKITNSNSFHPLARSLAHRLRPSVLRGSAVSEQRNPSQWKSGHISLRARACKDDDDSNSTTQAGAAKMADVPTIKIGTEVSLEAN